MDKVYQPTKWDKRILKAFPGWGKQRIQNRIEAAMITGAYEPTRSGKRPFDNYVRFLTSPNSRVTTSQRNDLIEFSRFLGYSGIGTAYTNRLTNLCIGSGLKFRAAVDAERLGLNKNQALEVNKQFMRLWNSFFNGENGHFERMYNGGYFQGLVFKSMLDGGDNIVFPAETKPRINHRFPFALQTVESERISTPTKFITDNRFVDGIEKNDQGIPIRVHVAKAYPKKSNIQDKAYFSPDFWQPLTIFGSNTGIRHVFHIKNLTQDRPGAMRGIPFLTPAMGLIIDHNELTEAVLKAAKIQSIFAGIWKGGKGGGKLAKAPTGNQTEQTSSTFPRVDLTGGQIIDMPEGYSLEAFQSNQPNGNFSPFEMHILAIISAITGISRSFVLMLFDKSYSASKGETSLTWVTVLRHRYAFVFQFLYPFWEFLLTWAVGSGNVKAPGFFRDPEIKRAWLGDPIHQFSGPRMPQLDLEKEAKGLAVMRDSGFKSTRGIIEETSTDDPEQVFRELEEEKERKIFGAVVKAAVENSSEDVASDQDNPDDQGGGNAEQ